MVVGSPVYAQSFRSSWITTEGQRCRVWDPDPKPNETVTWSGDCPGGLADGEGVQQWYSGGVPGNRVEGVYRRGHLLSGVITYPNGDQYIGALPDGVRTGHGMYKFANGDRYQGDFRAGKRDGRGVFTWANGDRYEGEFHDDNRGGQGVYTFADGKQQNGEWNYNRLVPSPPSGHDIHLTRINGVLTAPVTINDTVTLPFVVDSGASLVNISADVFRSLVVQKVITPADMRAPHQVRMADGSERMQPVFVIRSLRVGALTLDNVTGSVGPEAAPLLLGQTFLERFRSWSVDNSEQVLHLN